MIFFNAQKALKNKVKKPFLKIKKLHQTTKESIINKKGF